MHAGVLEVFHQGDKVEILYVESRVEGSFVGI